MFIFFTHGKKPNSEQEQPPLAHDTARTALLLNEARNATCSLTVEIHAWAIIKNKLLSASEILMVHVTLLFPSHSWYYTP